jgi:hypothetical protein
MLYIGKIRLSFFALCDRQTLGGCRRYWGREHSLLRLSISLICAVLLIRLIRLARWPFSLRVCILVWVLGPPV